MRWTGADHDGRARALGAIAVVAMIAMHPRVARADEPASSTALAQQLYDDAKAAMAKEDYAAACQKFAESHRLDPATGGTLLNLAVCHEKMGRTATAWGEFEEAAQLARHFARPDREKLAQEHIDKLRPFVSMLTLRVAEESSLSIEDLKIKVDGMAIGRAAWGSIPLDPGDHTVKAEAPGKVPWGRHLMIGNTRETPSIDVPLLVDEPRPGHRPADEAAAAELARSASAHRAMGFLLGGIGTAGVAIGSAFGLAAIHLNGQSKTNCSKPGACPPDPEGSQALVDANISNVAFGVAIVGLAVGTYFLLTTPSKPTPPGAPTSAWRSLGVTPSVASHGGSVGVSCAW